MVTEGGGSPQEHVSRASPSVLGSPGSSGLLRAQRILRSRWYVLAVALVAVGTGIGLGFGLSSSPRTPRATSGSVVVQNVKLAENSGFSGFPDFTCPSVSLCVAVDGSGDVYFSTDPARSGPWNDIKLAGFAPPSLNYLSCPSSGFCVAVGTDVSVSTDPTGGSAAWAYQGLSNLLYGYQLNLGPISCASAALCVSVGGEGGSTINGNTLDYFSTDPGGGAAAWHAFDLHHAFGLPNPSNIPSYLSQFGSVSCPSVSLCVAGGVDGQVAVSTDPAGGSSTWKVSVIEPSSRDLNAADAHTIGGITCVGVNFCVAVDGLGGILTSTDPTRGSAAWHRYRVPGVLGWGAPLCPISSWCGDVFRDTHFRFGTVLGINPLAGPSAWGPLHRLWGSRYNPVSGSISCPSVGRCYLLKVSGSPP